MRKDWILGAIVVVAVAGAGFVAGTQWRGDTPHGPSAPTAEATLPAPPSTPVEQPSIAAPERAAPANSAETPSPEAQAAARTPSAEPTPEQPATAAPPTTAEAAPPPPPADPVLPTLPTRVVAARPVHVVPEGDPAPQAKSFDIRPPSGGAAVAAVNPGDLRSAAKRGPTPQIAGAAQASGATALLVGGHAYSLFGVRPPGSGDRCIAANSINVGPAPPCAEKALATLAARLAHNPSVSCRLPTPTSAAAAAICLDADGVDLGGLLVAEGLALADPSQSYDYVGAEQVARSQRRGLWHFR